MERRRHPRHVVDRPAKISLPSGDILPARIVDVSEGGARLRVGWKYWLPKAFDLQDVFTGAHRIVWTVWRQFSSIGVRYEDSKSDDKRHSDFGHRRSDD
jgi:hypothetical protein